MSERSQSLTTTRRPRTVRVGRRRLARLLGMTAIVAALLTPSALVASATVPGTPGTPQAGTPVYTENFSNQNA